MQIIQSTSTSPTFNLATEEYLFTECQEEILFFYVNEPSVIIGCNQGIQNEVNLDYCRENNIQVVRLMFGGGSVYYDLENLNYSFISNKTKENSSLNPDFLNPIVEVLKIMGIPVEIGKRKDLWLPGGFKISGTASHVGKKRELHHGTLLYDTNLELLQKSLDVKNKNIKIKGITSVPSKVKNIKTHLESKNINAPTSNEFIEICLREFCKYYQTDFRLLNENEIAETEALTVKKYRSEEWTFKK